MELSRFDRWFWRVILILNGASVVEYAISGTDNKWNVVINGFFTLVGMFVLRADYLTRHPDEPEVAEPTRGAL